MIDKENYNSIESAFATHKAQIKPSSDLDKAILEMADAYSPKTTYKNSVYFLRNSFVTIMMLIILLMGYKTYQEISFKKECLLTYNKMIQAVEQKNIEKSLQFYDFNNLNLSPENVKKNITELYRNYDTFSYKIKNIKIKTKGKNAIGTSRYVFTAFNNGEKVLSYKGRDRIYFNKKNKKIKIYAWINK